MASCRLLLGGALLLLGCSSGSAGPPGATSDGGPSGSSGGGSGAGSSGAGSGSSGGTSVGVAQSDGGSCASSPVQWKDDGVQHCASSAEAILGTNTAREADGAPDVETTLELAILQPQTSYIFSISVTAQAPFGGTYGCTATPLSVVEVNYDDVGVFATTPVSCSVTVALTPTDGGMVASGTFSIMLMVEEGGSKVLSDGIFSLPVTSG